MLKKVWGVIFGIGFIFQSATGQNFLKSPDTKRQNQWVDSVYQSMTEEERIGQLFMVAAYSNKNATHTSNLELLVKEYHIGGLIFFQGGPGREAIMTNQLQKAAKVPLWIGMDAEWGLGMRLDSTMNFPKQMTLGAIQDDSLLYKMGAEIARQARLVGVHVNFAPVVDINSNPKNPVIGFRSFGQDRENVANKGIAYMKGMQDHGVLANAKHFPGHGDTDTDSHLTLPQLNHSAERMDSLELYPFKKLIDADISSIMVAHLNVPLYDDTPNKATTLSKNVVTNLLKDKLGFKGLIFTDALNMKGVSSFYDPGETDLLALQAGNDVLLFPMNVPDAIKMIKKALKKEDLTQERLAESVKKILAAKYWLGLTKTPKPLKTEKLHEQLHTKEAKQLNKKLYEAAATLVKTKNNFVPIHILDTTNFASLSLRAKNKNTFQQYLSNYANFEHYNLAENEDDPATYTKLLNQLKSYETVVVSMHDMSNYASKRFGVRKDDLLFLKELGDQCNVVLTVFGNAYSLKYLSDFDHILLMYEENEITQQLAPQILFGALPAKGKLPVSISKKLPVGTGIMSKTLNRFGFKDPDEVGMDPDILKRVDAIAEEAITTKATPGCQILIAKDGQIILKKGYGYLTYDSLSPVTNETIYDLASITKVAATLQTMMFLYDNDLVSLDKKIYHYLPELKRTNKKSMVLQDILLHQAGLTPYIPFWKKTVDEFGVQPPYYSIYHEKEFDFQIASDLYANKHLRDSLWQWTIESDLLSKPRWQKKYDYRYSDVGYYIMQKLAERILNDPINNFLEQNFYQPLGLNTMTYLPLCDFPEERIAPTEDDALFRKDLITGLVHDQGAAMYGGIAGHAGLFSNAQDLAILMQMNLWDGNYGGVRYFSKGTVPFFAQKHYEENRRGLGWDKPVMEDGPSPTSHYSSGLTFGHTGFTGTAAWADPEFGLVFIFLSNRIHPDANNRKLITNDIRTRIMDVIYESIFSFEEKSLEYIN